MSDKRLFLKPAEGRAVRRQEDGEPWPAEGDFTERTQFVRRRLKDGDLIEAQPPKPAKPAGDEKK
jgi:hypothetical protein